MSQATKNQPVNLPTFAELAAALPEVEKQYLIERAAVREFDGNLSRTEAEAGAVEDWLARQRELSPGAKLPRSFKARLRDVAELQQVAVPKKTALNPSFLRAREKVKPTGQDREFD